MKTTAYRYSRMFQCYHYNHNTQPLSFHTQARRSSQRRECYYTYHYRNPLNVFSLDIALRCETMMERLFDYLDTDDTPPATLYELAHQTYLIGRELLEYSQLYRNRCLKLIQASDNSDAHHVTYYGGGEVLLYHYLIKDTSVMNENKERSLMRLEYTLSRCIDNILFAMPLWIRSYILHPISTISDYAQILTDVLNTLLIWMKDILFDMNDVIMTTSSYSPHQHMKHLYFLILLNHYHYYQLLIKVSLRILIMIVM